MILLDDRVGSRHYAQYLGDHCTVTRLESGDAAFAGCGASVGIEVKRLPDAVNCMFTGRLADTQIPAMKQSYDVCYLVIEGLWQPDPQGVLQRYKGELGKWGKWHDAAAGRKRLLYGQFEKWLTTMEQMGGVRIRWAAEPHGTAALLLALYQWWLTDDHKSFRVMQEPGGDTASLTRPGMLRRMLAELDGVGWERSGILARRFKSMKEAVDAPPEAWLIERQIAMPTAEKIVRMLHGAATKS